MVKITPKETNARFIELWDTLIPKAMENGYICSEMDMGSIMHEQLKKDFVDGINYRCYQDISLLYPNETELRAEYDLAILHYPNGTKQDNKQNHHPAIVAEFKLWKGLNTIGHDINKLEALLKQEKGCFAHSMGVLDICTDKSFKILHDLIDNCKNKGWEAQLKPLPCELITIVIEYSQWKRYKGDPYKYSWYPLKRDGIAKNKQRKLITLRLSKSA